MINTGMKIKDIINKPVQEALGNQSAIPGRSVTPDNSPKKKAARKVAAIINNTKH